jgi:hypothetical protein
MRLYKSSSEQRLHEIAGAYKTIYTAKSSEIGGLVEIVFGQILEETKLER